MTEETEGFALDHGPVAEAVKVLLRESSAASWIDIRTRPHAVEIEAIGLPTAAWSRGEQLVWNFALSIAGRGKVNLGDVAGYFRFTPLCHEIHAVMQAALGIDVPPPERQRTASEILAAITGEQAE